MSIGYPNYRRVDTMALEQWNAKVEEGLKQRLEQINTDFDSKGKMLETLLDMYQMKKIQAGELKDVQKATLDAISGDFGSLDDLTRAIQRVFLGMVEKLGYREAEAIKEVGIQKERIELLTKKHDEEIKNIKEKENEALQQLEKLNIEYIALKKDAALFEEKEKNLIKENERAEEELKRRVDRIGELDKKVSEMEPLAKENQKLRNDLQQKQQELESAAIKNNHAIELLNVKHDKALGDKIKETKDTVSAEYTSKIEQMRDKWEEQSEKRAAAARADEREQTEKRIAALREQASQELERVKQAYEFELKKLEQKK